MNGMGMEIVFGTLTNLGSILERPKGTEFTFQSSALCDFVNHHGFVVLGNARHLGNTNVDASASLDIDGLPLTHDQLPQDSFHCDEHWTFKKPSFFAKPRLEIESEAGHITALYNIGQKRLAPTLYAPADDVRAAIQKIDRSGLHPALADALDAQSDPAYGFTFHPGDIPARKTLQGEWNEFTQVVYDAIPEGHKYRMNWQTDYSMVLHSNHRHILHARPRSNDHQNLLLSLNITPTPK